MFVHSSLTFCRRLSFHFRRVQFSPLPEKAATGGEDAYLSLANVQCVLDGVSWWRSNAQVDAGLYSAALARSMYSLIEESSYGDSPSCSYTLLQSAYEHCAQGDILGTCTALVAMLQPSMPEWASHNGYTIASLDDASSVPLPSLSSSAASVATVSGPLLDVALIGDCTLMLLRNGEIVYATTEQQHDLDYPFQLGTGSKDTPADSVRVLVPVRKGDVVVMGTDGVFDNLYQPRIAELLWPPLAAAFAQTGFMQSSKQAATRTRQDASAAAASVAQSSVVSGSDVRDRRLLHGVADAHGGFAATVPRVVHTSPPLSSSSSSLVGVRARLGEVITAALDLGMQRVMAEATLVSKDVHCDSPYASKCIEDGALYEGGKPDDMTLLVSVLDDVDEYALGERVVRDGELLYPVPYRDWP